MNDEYVLVHKSWILNLEALAQTTSKDINETQAFSAVDRAFIQLLVSTLYGYIASGDTIIRQGQQLAQVQNDKMADYKQQATDAWSEVERLSKPEMIDLNGGLPPDAIASFLRAAKPIIDKSNNGKEAKPDGKTTTNPDERISIDEAKSTQTQHPASPQPSR